MKNTTDKYWAEKTTDYLHNRQLDLSPEQRRQRILGLDKARAAIDIERNAEVKKLLEEDSSFSAQFLQHVDECKNCGLSLCSECSPTCPECGDSDPHEMLDYGA